MSDRVYCLTRVYGSDYERVVCVDTRPRAPSRQGGTAKLQLVRCVIPMYAYVCIMNMMLHDIASYPSCYSEFGIGYSRGIDA